MVTWPSVEDNDEAALQELRAIRQALQGNNPGAGTDGTVNVFQGQGVSGSVGAINPSTYQVRESDDLDTVDDGGTVTLQPGETKTLVRAENDSGLAVLALGASDEPDVQYHMKIDGNRTVGGYTNSPLGLLTDPFSFVESFGVVVPAERLVEYKATYASTATGEINLAARLHYEELSR